MNAFLLGPRSVRWHSVFQLYWVIWWRNFRNKFKWKMDEKINILESKRFENDKIFCFGYGIWDVQSNDEMMGIIFWSVHFAIYGSCRGLSRESFLPLLPFHIKYCILPKGKNGFPGLLMNRLLRRPMIRVKGLFVQIFSQILLFIFLLKNPFLEKLKLRTLVWKN